MTAKSTRYMDNLGRINLPSHIRKALNLGVGQVVEVTLEDDGSIRIRPTKERCCICGDAVGENGKPHITLAAGPEPKFVCYDCAQETARAMLKD